MNATAIILAVIGILLGIAGTVIPFLPGIPLIYLSILAYGWYEGFQSVSSSYIIILGGLTVLSLAVDYFSSIIGAKYFGSSKQGIYGALIGTVAGIFILPPAGIFLGPWIGACIGELLSGKDVYTAMRTGLGTMAGILSGLAFKLILAVIMFISFLVIIF